MLVGVCTITLRLHATQSLKDKRSIVKSLIARLQQRLNVGVAEVGGLDEIGRAVIAIATVSLSESVVRDLFRSAEEMAERSPGAEVVAVEVEFR